MVAGRVADDLVIRLGTAVERAEQVDLRAAHVEFVQMAAATGREKRDDAIAGQADFFTGVEIEVVRVDLHPACGTARRPPRSACRRQSDGCRRRVASAADRARRKHRASTSSCTGRDRVRSVPGRRVRPFDGLFFRGDLLQPLADLQHAGVHLVGFGVLRAEVPPGVLTVPAGFFKHLFRLKVH